MDPLQKLDRGIRVLVGMIVVAAALLIGARIMFGRQLVKPAPEVTCAKLKRVWDPQRQVCLPP